MLKCARQRLAGRSVERLCHPYAEHTLARDWRISNTNAILATPRRALGAPEGTASLPRTACRRTLLRHGAGGGSKRSSAVGSHRVTRGLSAGELSEGPRESGRGRVRPRGWPVSARITVGIPTDMRAHAGGKSPGAGARRSWEARDGGQALHANAACCAAARGGGSTASFRCRRIFWMTRTSVIAAMMRRVPC